MSVIAFNLETFLRDGPIGNFFGHRESNEVIEPSKEPAKVPFASPDDEIVSAESKKGCSNKTIGPTLAPPPVREPYQPIVDRVPSEVVFSNDEDDWSVVSDFSDVSDVETRRAKAFYREVVLAPRETPRAPKVKATSRKTPTTIKAPTKIKTPTKILRPPPRPVPRAIKSIIYPEKAELLMYEEDDSFVFYDPVSDSRVGLGGLQDMCTLLFRKVDRIVLHAEGFENQTFYNMGQVLHFRQNLLSEWLLMGLEMDAIGSGRGYISSSVWGP